MGDAKSVNALTAQRWLLGLMRRHSIDLKDFDAVANRTRKAGAPVDRTTVMRIAKAESKTAPRWQTMESIARAFGERFLPGEEGRVVGQIVVGPDGTYDFKTVDGSPVTPEVARASRRAISRKAAEEADVKEIKDRSAQKRRQLEEE